MFPLLFLVLAVLNFYYAGVGLFDFPDTGDAITGMIALLNVVCGAFSVKWYFEALD